jgi:hypothetical protein
MAEWDIWDRAAGIATAPPPPPTAPNGFVGPVQSSTAPKSDIWDRAAAIKPETSVLDDIGDDIGDTLKQYWDKASPVKQAQSVADTAASPLAAGKGYIQQQNDLAGKATDSFKKGQYLDSVRHGLMYMLNGIPGVGALLDQAGNKAENGDYKGAVADTGALATYLLEGKAIGSGTQALTEPGAITQPIVNAARKVGDVSAATGAAVKAATPGVVGGLATVGAGEVLSKIPGMEWPARLAVAWPGARMITGGVKAGARAFATELATRRAAVAQAGADADAAALALANHIKDTVPAAEPSSVTEEAATPPEPTGPVPLPPERQLPAASQVQMPGPTNAVTDYVPPKITAEDSGPLPTDPNTGRPIMGPAPSAEIAARPAEAESTTAPNEIITRDEISRSTSVGLPGKPYASLKPGSAEKKVVDEMYDNIHGTAPTVAAGSTEAPTLTGELDYQASEPPSAPEPAKPAAREPQWWMTPEEKAKAAATSQQPITANVPAAEGERSGTNNLSTLQTGNPGISTEGDPILSRLKRIVYRDAQGRPQGYLQFYLDDSLKNVAPPGHGLNPEVYVSPTARRNGVATQLYDAAKKQGYDLSAVSGTETTPAGAAFLNSRAATASPAVTPLATPTPEPAATPAPAEAAPLAVKPPSSRVVEIPANPEQNFGASKLMTEEGLTQYAKDNGVTEEEAANSLAADGYSVVGRSQINRALHGIASELGMDHDTLSDVAKIKHRVKSMTQLSQEDMLGLYQDLLDKRSASEPLINKPDRMAAIEGTPASTPQGSPEQAIPAGQVPTALQNKPDALAAAQALKAGLETEPPTPPEGIWPLLKPGDVVQLQGGKTVKVKAVKQNGEILY